MFLFSLPWLALGPNWFLSASLSYLSHLIGDMMTVRGVALLYPLSIKYYRIAKFKSSSALLNLGAIALSGLLIYLKFYTLLGVR